ncbi:MAG: hypothetical protein GEU83_10165 [Pseudonocardiaceae bacterium]|nr:hypothetical protein [Pseudonocardiaceae bacterium]
MPPDLHLRPRLLAAGYTDAELLRLRRAESVTTVRPGAYVQSGDDRLREPAAHHALLVEATLARLTAGAVVSHVSAAVLHGLPVWNLALGRVHVTRAARAGGRVTRRLHVHVTHLEADDVVDLGGVAVTSVARTIVDLARSVPFEQAVVIADAALRVRLVSPDELLVVQHRSSRRHGGPAAWRVVAFADGRSESVGESRSRVALSRFGLPAPAPQWEVRSADGTVVGRVDFGWPELRTVGEFDGRVKYGRLLRAGQEPGDAVLEEKLREDALRGERLSVVRWTWADLDRFEPVAARVRRGFSAR